jgi:hypothetical protein
LVARVLAVIDEAEAMARFSEASPSSREPSGRDRLRATVEGVGVVMLVTVDRYDAAAAPVAGAMIRVKVAFTSAEVKV